MTKNDLAHWANHPLLSDAQKKAIKFLNENTLDFQEYGVEIKSDSSRPGRTGKVTFVALLDRSKLTYEIEF